MITITIIKDKILIIDKDKVYPIVKPFSLRKQCRSIRNRSVIYGFVGPRGSGKSVGGARLAIIDYILQGVTNVWSNMDIGFKYYINGSSGEFHSKPIDKLTLIDLDRVYSDGLIFQDEVNMSIADSRRATSRGTLAFDYVVQQLRKRRLNLIWTAQSEDQVEMRLRNATDIYIKCMDLSLVSPKCGMGEISLCKYYDYGGLINRQLPDNHFDGVFKEIRIRNKPWWNSYSTWQLQGMEEEIKADIEEKSIIKIDEIARFIEEYGEPVLKSRIWKQYSICEHRDRIKVGVALSQKGILTSYDRKHFVLEKEPSLITP